MIDVTKAYEGYVVVVVWFGVSVGFLKVHGLLCGLGREE
jgi:hypothetical protein